MARTAASSAGTPSGDSAVRVISSETESFDPALAQRWLVEYAYLHQRPVRKQHVAAVKYQMVRGRFRPGTQIKLVDCVETKKKYLVNGQHRLIALSECPEGTSVEFVVTRMKVPTLLAVGELYALEDTPKVRTPIDSFAPLGLTERTNLSKNYLARVGAAVGIISTGFVTHTKRPFKIAQRTHYVRTRAMEDWLPYGALFHECIKAGSKAIQTHLTNGEIMAVALVTLRYQEDAAKTFWADIANNAGLAKGDPRKYLVDYLLEKKGGTWERSRATRSKARYAAGCWNAYFEDQRDVERIDPSGLPLRIAGAECYDGTEPVLLDYEDVPVEHASVEDGSLSGSG